MNTTLKLNQIILWTMIVLPFLYLAYLWGQLPEIVPVHWNVKGKADGFGPKISLLFVALLPLFVFGVLRVAQKIDPKQNLKSIRAKMPAIELIVTGFMSAISLFAIYSALKSDSPMSFLILLFGMFFVLLGNYMQTILPNYFIGIRTPWTLQNDLVWKKTHRFTGRLWMLGGALVVLGSLINVSLVTQKFFLPLLLILVLVPIFYSYWIYREMEHST